MLNNPNGAVAYRFHARDLHLVTGPATPRTSVGYGQPPGAAHRIYVDEQSAATVTEQRLYQLIRQPMEFLGSGVEFLHSHSVDRLRKCKWRFPNG
jgi:hypothetical protein